MADKDTIGGSETVGGTSARLEAGREGRGRIRKQRVPELKGDLGKPVKKLRDQCQAVMEHMGHEPEDWYINETGDSGQLKCAKCGKVAGYAENPMFERIVTDRNTQASKLVQRDHVNGVAVEVRCKS